MLTSPSRKTIPKQVERHKTDFLLKQDTYKDWYFEYVSNPQPELLLMLNTWRNNCSNVCINNTTPDV